MKYGICRFGINDMQLLPHYLCILWLAASKCLKDNKNLSYGIAKKYSVTMLESITKNYINLHCIIKTHVIIVIVIPQFSYSSSFNLYMFIKPVHCFLSKKKLSSKSKVLTISSLFICIFKAFGCIQNLIIAIILAW